MADATGQHRSLAVISLGVMADTAGRMRPRGQSTLTLGTCLGIKTIPFMIDFAHANASQTLFGVEKASSTHTKGVLWPTLQASGTLQ